MRYELSIPSAEERVLREWNEQDPPDQIERERNELIQSVQGNRNPFVDFPHLAHRIDNF